MATAQASVISEDVFVNDIAKRRAHCATRCAADHGPHQCTSSTGEDRAARSDREDAERGSDTSQRAQGAAGFTSDVATLNSRAVTARTNQRVHSSGSFCGDERGRRRIAPLAWNASDQTNPFRERQARQKPSTAPDTRTIVKAARKSMGELPEIMFSFREGRRKALVRQNKVLTKRRSPMAELLGSQQQKESGV